MKREATERAFWKQFNLQFFDKKMERDYQELSESAHISQDFAAQFTSYLIPPLVVRTLWHTAPWWYLTYWLFYPLIYSPFILWLIWNRRALYKKHRLRIVSLVRCVFNLGLVPAARYIPTKDPLRAMVAIVALSPTMCTLFCSLVLRVQIKRHIFTSLVALAECFLWIPSFCDRCEHVEELTSKFNQVGKAINFFHETISPMTSSYKDEYPCWMVTCMVMIIFAFILPTLLVVSAEVYARTVFLKLRLENALFPSVDLYAKQTIHVALLVSLFLSFTSWYLLIILRDSGMLSPHN